MNRPQRDILSGEPCDHPGCLAHVSHPCEGCGRIAGHGDIWVNHFLSQPWERPPVFRLGGHPEGGKSMLVKLVREQFSMARVDVNPPGLVLPPIDGLLEDHILRLRVASLPANTEGAE